MEDLPVEAAACSWARAAACTAIGPRPTNDDAHLLQCIWIDSQFEPSLASASLTAPGLFVVCDGHGGPSVAHRVVERLGTELWTTIGEHSSASSSKDDRKRAAQDAFRGMDLSLRRDHLRQSFVCGCTCIAAMVWPLSENGDRSMTVKATKMKETLEASSRSRSRSRCRSRAPAGVVVPSSYRLLLANLGDSRAVLCRGGAVVDETEDHRPSQPDEEKRIRAAGGFVSKPNPVTKNPARIDGVLAVSRAFGDFFLKHDSARMPDEQKVSPVPDIYEIDALPGDILVLACDGVFDVLTSVAVAEIAFETMSASCGSNVGLVAEAVVRRALVLGTVDNVTCVIVQLGSNVAPVTMPEYGPTALPKVSAEAPLLIDIANPTVSADMVHIISIDDD